MTDLKPKLMGQGLLSNTMGKLGLSRKGVKIELSKARGKPRTKKPKEETRKSLGRQQLRILDIFPSKNDKKIGGTRTDE